MLDINIEPENGFLYIRIGTVIKDTNPFMKNVIYSVSSEKKSIKGESILICVNEDEKVSEKLKFLLDKIEEI